MANLSFWRQTSANIGKIGWSVFFLSLIGWDDLREAFYFLPDLKIVATRKRTFFWCRGKFAVTDFLLISHSSAPFASYRTLLSLGETHCVTKPKPLRDVGEYVNLTCCSKGMARTPLLLFRHNYKATYASFELFLPWTWKCFHILQALFFQQMTP